MEKSLIENKINAIVSRYVTAAEAVPDNPLTLAPYRLDARELTSVFLDIESEFGIDIDKLFEAHIDFSITSLVNAVEIQIG